MATTPDKVAEKAAAAESAGKKKGSKIPDNALRPQDHKPAKADVAKNGEPCTFEYKGHEYTLIDDAFEVASDIDFAEKLQDGNLIGPTRQLLGFEQWGELKDRLREEADGKPVGQDLLQPFFETMMKALKAKNS